MRANEHISKAVKCPYYHYHGGVKIVCDGALTDSVSAHSIFMSADARQRYQRSVCETDGWRCCPWARTLEEKGGPNE